MSREWKPGDVALVTAYANPKIALVRPRREAIDLLEFAYVEGGYDIAGDADVPARPLVVIDVEDREQVARLADAFCNARWSHLPDSDECDPLTRSSMKAALRSLLEPQKPEEPAGIGAVVEYDGSVWISLGHHRWLELPDDRLIEPRRFHWADFPSGVRILSDGWTPDASGGAS